MYWRENKMKKEKILLFVLALIILVGVAIVCIKGFKVSLELRAHDTLKFVFDQKFETNDVKKVCNEVFKDKEYEIKTVEIFSDAVYIISPDISGEEKDALVEKLEALYPADTSDAEETTEEGEETSNYKLYHDSKVRIRDIVKPYVIPSVVCALLTVIYIGIRYRKLNNKKVYITVCKTLGEMLVVLLTVMAIIAICRIPFTKTMIPIVMFIIVISLCIRLMMFEKELEELK